MSLTNFKFSDVLAAAAHDMKNSLGLLLQSVESLGQQVPDNLEIAHECIANTHYEAARLNTNLVQLLSLYKSDVQDLPLTIDEHSINDLFSDIRASNEYYSKHNNLTFEIDSEDQLYWFFDSELLYLLVNDAVINALRYGKTKVKLSAKVGEQDGHSGMFIVVEDDGPGYPVSMLDEQNSENQSTHVRQGRTGLGMYFARLIAHAHQNDGITGKISLKNGGSLGGSVFSVFLP